MQPTAWRPTMKRRQFVKTLSATGVALYASDLVGDLMAQSPKARVMESRFKGLSDVALSRSEAARLHIRRYSLHAQHQRQRRRSRSHRHRLVRLRRRWPRRERRLRRSCHSQRRVGIRQQSVRDRGGDQTNHRAGDRGRQGERHEQAIRGEAVRRSRPIRTTGPSP